MHTKEDYLDAIEMAYPGQLASESRDQVWNSIEPLIAEDANENYEAGYREAELFS